MNVLLQGSAQFVREKGSNETKIDSSTRFYEAMRLHFTEIRCSKYSVVVG